MEFHKQAIVMDSYQEILDEYVYRFLENESDAATGKDHVFDSVYKPVLKKQGVRFVNMAVGGDHVAQVMYSASEFRFWDATKKLDILNTEAESGCDSFIICRTRDDIETAIRDNRIGIFATLSGGRPLEGKPNLNLLSSLRNLYRLGLRGLQLTGNNRNRLGDGCAQVQSRGKLTSFGEKVVKEAERLGIVLDSSQLSDFGFYDLMELTEAPVIDSHTGASAISGHPRNISDNRIRTIAKRGGVIGISFRAALMSQEKETPDETDLLKHIDHVIRIAGIDHVALGPDFSAYKTPVNRDAVKGFSNLGPDFCEFDKLTPVQSEKYPGFVEGVWYGIRNSDFIQGPDHHEVFPQISDILINHGYNTSECRKILGENMLRVYRQVLR